MKGNKIKSYCIRCNFETNHTTLHHEFNKSSDTDFDYVMDYYMVKCLGCDRISYRQTFTDLTAAYPNDNGEWDYVTDIQTFPEKLKTESILEQIYVLPEQIKLVYNEAIGAYNASCFILTGVAFRAVIEAICLVENIKGGNLEKKINSLVRLKLITEKESKRLHSIRFIGNDSVHEMKVPNENSLKIVLHIIQHLLNNLYIIDFNSQKHLETVIDDFTNFEPILNLNIKKFQKGDEVPLAKILAKNVRRLNGGIPAFQTILIDKINNKLYHSLSIGKVDIYGDNKNHIQHFIIN